ncbi:HyaD/HybD family hydrogenase maturation endopeptidase [Sulfurovum sp. NBC37-1]|uniref:HyaD/HybD family hydrogenase maturation endopeptidase n=1 Tax=Sulfurovum sp. (strain NBC37-1) TaxID=387093 RepID=UPI0001587CD8|nr:HyaD/HybD family hydrogenase maturation endopeptidase [Sulfurovum sp. NBC37-1]BAF72592.1 hydrogenase formation/expression protease [Sulfurovum sp. NBC37-1]
MTILGIGNVLQKDDGLGVYAAAYLKENYDFSKEVKIVNGGVEGINLLNLFMENDDILILDTIHIDDAPGSIYLIPAQALSGYGLNSGGAHEIGVIQCLDMLELQGRPVPEATVLGIIPHEVTFDIALSDPIKASFSDYINTALRFLEKQQVFAIPKEEKMSLKSIIMQARDPSGIMT